MYTRKQLLDMGLQLNKGEFPAKYSYVPKKGACRWKEVEKERIENKGITAIEKEMLVEGFPIIYYELGKPKKIIIVDLGCGTGEVVKGLIQHLYNLDLEVKYYALDISSECIKLCKNNLLSAFSNLEFGSIIVDFETLDFTSTMQDISRSEKSPLLCLLLGNTLGNYTSLSHILVSITQGLNLYDRLIVGIEKSQTDSKRWINSVMQFYKSKKMCMQSFSGLEELGVSLDSGNFEVEYNPVKNQAEIWFCFSKQIDIKTSEFEINFDREERVLLQKSKKLSEPEFSKLLQEVNLRIGMLRTDKNNKYLQALIHPLRL